MRARALGELGPGPARLFQPDKARAPRPGTGARPHWDPRPRPDSRPSPAHRPRNLVRRHWLSAAVLAAGVMVAVFAGRAFLLQELRIRELRAEAALISRQLSTAGAENTALKQEMIRLNSLEYVETVARQQLGLIKPGEQQFMAVDGSGTSR